MTNSEILSEKIVLLKEARLQLLRLHKLLVDIERENFERINGQITSGHFLNLLVSDQNFSWLRKFSTLIVEIDEMLDLDDGFTEAMVETHISQMRQMLSLTIDDKDFNDKYKSLLQANPEIAGKHSELKRILSE